MPYITACFKCDNEYCGKIRQAGFATPVIGPPDKDGKESRLTYCKPECRDGMRCGSCRKIRKGTYNSYPIYWICHGCAQKRRETLDASRDY